MKIFKKIVLFCIAIFLISCEDVIEVDLETAEPKLVIDASIDWIKGTSGNEQKIKITTTTSYYSEEFPTVSGAEVVVRNSENVEFNFVENPGTGEYICNNFEPILGETYTLTINLNGEIYTATETLMSVPNIEEEVIQRNDGGIGADEIELTYHYQDDPTQENFYVYNFQIPYIVFPQYSVENDENNNGNLTPVYFFDEDLKAGDVVNFKLYGISRRYYDYFRKLLNASGSSGNPFATTPNAVLGNIVNQSDNQDFTFGYFRLSEVSVKDYTIQ